ncbi:MAG: hypothetical protein ACFFKA_04430 [Candidatus Thorarchaeota archaeon]
MRNSIVVLGVIILLAGILLAYVGNAGYEKDKNDYIMSKLGYRLYPPSFYEDLMVADEGIFVFGVILVIVSFIIMISGVFMKEKNSLERKKQIDRRCPYCGRAIPFDAKECPYCGKKFEDFL